MTLIEIRHDLHAHPGLSGDEHYAHDLVVRQLALYRPDTVYTHVGGYGVVAVWGKEPSHPTIAIRGDIDALPIGHRCGHDGHTTILLQLAEYIAQRGIPTGRNVMLIYQPEEETGLGAQKIIDANILQQYNIRAIYGLHNLPGFHLGTVVLNRHTFAAASTGIVFRLMGRETHASTPEKGENAITMFLDSYCGENLLIQSLGELFPHGEFSGKSCGLGFRDELSGDMTCVLSMLNTENGRICGAVDIRFPLDRTKSEISGIICDALEGAGFTVDSCEGVEPHCTDENSEFVQGLLRVYERVTGDKAHCIAIGGGTYVHDIEGGVAFGAEFPNEDGRMHSPDEFITVANLLKNAEIMAEAMAELCG